jgi:hypothetical protein
MHMHEDSQIWSVDLNAHWAGAGLSSVFIEKKINPEGYREARAALTRDALRREEWFNLDEPVRLQTHREPKPWGAEIWYTGIEKRGVCHVENRSGLCISLPVFLAMQAGSCEHIATPPLLKILDPFPERSRGSLYIEVHEKKWETYIVTGVDPVLYPDGEGELLFGFSQEKLSAFGGNHALFKTSLLADVRAYEVLRRALDGEHGEQSPALLSGTAAQADAAWRKLQSYFNMRKVRVGDVLQVPPFTPHSLQAGVRVVEFQNPVYERLILAFNQKVLTQGYWDTERALELASFETPQSSSAAAESGWQTIVSFPEFDVGRCFLQNGDSIVVPPSKSGGHRVVFVIVGEIAVCSSDTRQLMKAGQGQAFLLPSHIVGHNIQLVNDGHTKAAFLLV